MTQPLHDDRTACHPSFQPEGQWFIADDQPQVPLLPRTTTITESTIEELRELVRTDTCACQKSNTYIQMMESAKKWRGQNVTTGMYCSRQWRVLVD